jgi:hypothetical protein
MEIIFKASRTVGRIVPPSRVDYLGVCVVTHGVSCAADASEAVDVGLRFQVTSRHLPTMSCQTGSAFWRRCQEGRRIATDDRHSQLASGVVHCQEVIGCVALKTCS